MNAETFNMSSTDSRLTMTPAGRRPTAADLVTVDSRSCSPFSTVLEAALVFRDEDCGTLPVLDAGKLIGGSCQFCAHGVAGRDFLKSASPLRVSGEGNAGGASLWGSCPRRLAPVAPTVNVEPPPRPPMVNRVAVYPLGPGRI
jgi:hypothetical protein